MLFCVGDGGCTHLYRVGTVGGIPQPVIAGADRVVSGLSVAGTTAVVVLATATSLGEIVRVDLATGQETVLTQHGAAFDDVEWFARDPRQFSISDGTQVSGWLIRDPAKPGPLPLLLDVHGGPHDAWNGAADSVHLYHQELAGRGWAVLLINPRGSDGYGRQFRSAAVGAWGKADAHDLLEPVEELVAEGLADPQRLAVTGYSYGGFMTCYLTALDDRFAAAVAGGAISDLASLAGTSDAGHLLATYEIGGLPWRDPAWFGRLSPITHVADVHTPTLLIQGAADLRCPVGQAQQWHTALRERGVDSALVLYPDASHLMMVNGRPSHRIDYNHRVIDWVERYAGSALKVRPVRLDAAHWQRRLDELARSHQVPGAQLGILRVGEPEDELVEAAYGVLNLETGAPVTKESLFQIGSISKVWTATLAMQLVDEGHLDLDAPVVEVLPELRLSDPDVTKHVTVRHLLAHTSGLDGDLFTDTGRGDDCLARYVELLADAAQIAPMGATWSYCNSGFSLLGRIIEQITESTWDAAMRKRLFTPLGLTHTVTLPEEALLYSVAVGHVAESGSAPRRAAVWGLPRSLGPAGLITSTAREVLAFARLHLARGRAVGGTRLLSEHGAAAMTERNAELPGRHTLGSSWGLGWNRYQWAEHQLIGHDGGTIGQSAFLRVLPERGLAVVLLVNGGDVRGLYEQLFREIFDEIADVVMPSPLSPPAVPIESDITPWLGSYQRSAAILEVLDGKAGPQLRTTVTGPLAALRPATPKESDLIAVDRDLYIMRDSDDQAWEPVIFYKLPTGERYIHVGNRATPEMP